MPNALKSFLKGYLLKDELAAVTRQKTRLEDATRARTDFINTLSVTDLMREQLAGFNPRLLDSEDDLPEILGEVEAQDVFLAGMKRLEEDEHLKTLIEYLKRNQVLHSAKEAQTLDAINFGRATVNGLTLLVEEITRLAIIYKVRHEKDVEFDEHEVL